ncbi:ABC transporter permease [Pseudogemmobacter faecipullorum]|uniref:ABC transporter permease subunit n=1 Tax=Pseudogemmobacter faecipullorum TaxID=2755041 RepID=A0ABS8CRB4_9RHOB|nr:ABC transporter permease subunit [Pseudogemmobacter faecipullorum]MCB5411908.1 ABC transporter permease subunit [Pseudogemmobacter faecipullorum]
MTCFETLQAYAFRSLGFGEAALPTTNITLCDQLVLIGSGMIWNLYFGLLALTLGFGFAIALALAKASPRAVLRKPAEWFIFTFRGSPLFIQFFLIYFFITSVLRGSVDVFGLFTLQTAWMANAWAGAALTLFFNTSAYSAEIFYGALMAVPKGDLEAAEAYGITGRQRFRRIEWPTMLRLAWPSYTNEAIFLFHATTLVFFSGFPVFQQRGDALYYASYFAGQTFNPFIPYPIVGGYFILLTLLLIWLFGLMNTRLNRHLPSHQKRKIRLRPQLIR